MIVHWLSQNSNQRVIIFCNGWGMDHRPLAVLDTSGYDVAVLSDYRHFEPPIELPMLARTYEIIYLLGWSFGVWAAQNLFSQYREHFSRCIAINGTLQPIDDRCGIPHQFFNATREQFSESVLNRFYRRMCRPQKVLDIFLEHRPARTPGDQGEELDALQRLAGSGDQSRSIYDLAIVSTKDLVVPTEHQLFFWKNRCRIIEVEGSHFPFSGWSSWSDIIAMAAEDGC